MIEVEITGVEGEPEKGMEKGEIIFLHEEDWEKLNEDE